MQQRRGTAQQWTDADPRLESGEIGFETDTNQFKIGDGVNVWSDLSYFKNLEDLGGSLDDYALANLIGAANGIASLDGSGKIPSAQLPDALSFDAEVTNAISTHNSVTTNVHGIANTAALATKAYVDTAAAAAVTGLVDGAPELLNTINELADAINNDANFANTVLTSVQDAQDAAESYAETFATGFTNNAIAQHNLVTTNVHGIANTLALTTTSYYVDTLALATTSYADGVANNATSIASTALANHNEDTSNVHGIANTLALALKSEVQDARDSATSALDAHGSDTSNVHGIADTSALATKTYADSAATDAIASAGVASANALSQHNSATVNVHGIANTAALALTADVNTALDLKANLGGANFTGDVKVGNFEATGTVLGISKAAVGLGNVDNTSDADKPVSSATQTALDLKANVAGPTFTGTVTANNLVVDGDLTLNGNTFNASATTITIEDNMLQLAHQNAANTVDLGLVVAYNDGSAKHAGLVRDVSDAKWKLFQGVTTEPTTTVNFGQGSLDALAVGALEATTVTPSSGVVFSDGTQTLEGVPSRTVIIQRSTSNTLSGVERDDLIEMGSSSATTLTIPADSTFNFPIGTSMDVLQTSTGQVTIAGAAGVTVNATPGLKLRTQWSSATLFKRAANTWVVYGDLTA